MFFTEVKNKCKVLEKSDESYPQEWLFLADAPEKIYALGDISLLKKRKLTVVGSRRTPTQILKLGEKTVKELSSVFTIVTGTADGGDTCAIEGALSNPQGKVICLLAGGFSALSQTQLPLLEKVAKRGLLLSVQDFETPARDFLYEYRNKLLAYLGKGTFLISAGEKSGALITAKYTKRQEKPVFAFPYPPASVSGTGCNQIIKQGGNLVEKAEDIAEYFGINLAQTERKISLFGEEESLYLALQEAGEMHAVELSERTGVPVYKIRALISSLEVKGLVVALGGNRYGVV